ncbi:MAG TPA: ThiF family adenylyltransferase [Solirubrobacterales bacterium]|jgi:molybdopterin/thiamine biosynthesis adenylyltransferase
MIEPAIILPRVYAERIAQSGKNSGTLDVKWDERELLALIDGFRAGRDGNAIRGLSDLPRKHHDLAHASTQVGMGLWFRADPELHVAGMQSRIVSGALPLDYFRGKVVGGDWTNPGRGKTITLTCAEVPEHEESHFAGWLLDAQSAEWCFVEVADEESELLAPLRPAWPLEEIAEKLVVVVGAGSIGSAACEALASYGVRRFALVDPDRLLTHNFARHRVGRTQLGRHKVNALAARLHERDPAVDVQPLPIDVIYDADVVRPVIAEADITLVCADGVEPRRVSNHLSRRAAKPAVFACVLADGAYGEILRIRPPRVGCLLCVRAELIAKGAMNPEPALDRGYGTGTRHLPMTAVGGDLGLVGELAAKVTAATLLERLGYREQRLPGDHAILALRPKTGMAPPFDMELAGDVRWGELPSPRADCPTCGSNRTTG